MNQNSIINKDKIDSLGLVWKPILAYLLWVVLRNILTKVAFFEKYWAAFNDSIAYSYIIVSAKSLAFFGIHLKHNSRNLILEGTEGIYVGNHCLGVSASFVFVFIILMLKGPLKYKIYYLLMGFLIIYLINLFRIIGLALMLKWSSDAFFQFNHSYTYLILIYGIIFFMIVMFEKKFSRH